MSSLIILRGLPGSGKSTYAMNLVQTTDTVRVNRDDLRKSLFGGEGILSADKEGMITRVQQSIAVHALRAGRDVVVDDTNLRAKYVRAWMDLAHENGAIPTIVPFNTPLLTCIANDAARERTVGEQVIKMLYLKFVRNGEIPPVHWRPRDTATFYPPVTYNPALPNCILVDIDGTMAKNTSGRDFFDWKRVGEDTPNRAVVDLVNRLLRDGYNVLFMSGRDSVCRPETEKWLNEYVLATWPNAWELHMRPEGDNRPDTEIKVELFDKFVRGRFNVRFVLDDRNSVVDMWRALGLDCFQVAPGNF
jgi:predicted kinase